MTRGDMVVVRTYGAKPRIRRVWDATPDVVYIASEENYHKHLADIDAPEPVGFQREAVFVYDPETFPTGAQGVPQDEAFWRQLQRYEG